MNTIQMIPIAAIDPHPKNPRHDLGDLAGFAKSIKAQGIRQNLLLVPQMISEIQEQDGHRHGPTHRFASVDNERYTVVIGHRRLAAAELAGLTEIPAVVDPTLTEADQLELMLLENLQRKEITAIEEAEGYQELLDLDVPVAMIAKKTGRTPKIIRDRLKLLDLPEVAQERIQSGQGSLLDAAKLEEFADDPDVQAELGALIGTNNFTQRLEGARETRKRRTKQQPIVDALAAKGLTEITDQASARGRSWITRISEVDRVEVLMVPDGSVFKRGSYYSDVDVWGPESAPDESESDEGAEAAAAARAERDAAWAAERAQRDAELAEAEECWKVRDAWIRERITGRFTHQQRAMIAEHVAPLMLTSSLSSWTTASWLGVEYSQTERTRVKAIAKFQEGLDWAAALLVLCHLIAGRSWTGSVLPALYEVLESLGYQVSDAERARITPPADDADDEEVA